MTDLPRRYRLRPYRVAVDFLQTVAQVILIFVIISALIGRFEIRQLSMEPNFHEGQRVVVSRLGSLWLSLFVSTAHAAEYDHSPFALHRGQIAVFFEQPGEADPLIKRVIGLPGETIEVRDGVVLVNGLVVDEPYLNGLTTNCSAYCGPITLEPDTYFMMGDNRPVSRDSRSFGPIHANQIVGRVVLRYWPFDQVQVYP